MINVFDTDIKNIQINLPTSTVYYINLMNFKTFTLPQHQMWILPSKD